MSNVIKTGATNAQKERLGPAVLPDARALAVVCVVLAVLLSGCGDKKLPTWSEITSSVTDSDKDKKEEGKTVAQQTQPTTSTSAAPDASTATQSATEPGGTTTAPGAETTAPPVTTPQPSVVAPEAAIAELQTKKWHISSETELSVLITKLGDRTDLVTKLNLAGSGITEKGIQELAKLPKLVDLDLKGVALTPAGWESVGKLTSLEKLDVSGSNLTDDDMAAIGQLTHLKELILDTIKNVTDSGYSQLVKLHELEVLSFQFNSKITGAAFGSIRKKNGFGKLRVMLANKTAIGRGGLGALTGLKTLEVFEAGDSEITNAILFKGLKGCTKLKKLVLGFNVQLSDQGLETLKEKKDLEIVNLRNCSLITDQTLQFLKGAKDLQMLDVQGTRINARTAADLKQKFTKKATISVDGRQI